MIRTKKLYKTIEKIQIIMNFIATSLLSKNKNFLFEKVQHYIIFCLYISLGEKYAKTFQKISK